MSENLLALDQASQVSGYSIFIDGKLVKYGKITLKDEEIGPRLVTLRKTIIDLIKEYNITQIAFEDIQMQASVGNNVKTFKVLANVYGVILELCEELKLKYEIVSSNTWKSTLKIKGKGRAEQKRAAQAFVQETYGIKCSQDEADAICIGSHMLKNSDSIGLNWAD